MAVPNVYNPVQSVTPVFLQLLILSSYISRAKMSIHNIIFKNLSLHIYFFLLTRYNKEL